MIALPIDDVLPELLRVVQSDRRVVLEAPPGAGKTTRVPPALASAVSGEVIVLEPRRLAARLAATRVAAELGEPLGQRVGYKVRYEDVGGKDTRIRYVTEGTLTRRLTSDPDLRGVGAVVLDEFHERHLQGDTALALLKRLMTRRPELVLVVMSATLDAEPVARFLQAERVRAEGRRFEVTIEHAEREDDRPLERQVAAAVKRLVVEEPQEGDILVFLPGAQEIARARGALGELAERHDLLLLPLYGDLPPAEQDRAIRPADRRKVILSTNVAETSVTIDGVGAVVDSGLARVASHSPWSGLPALRVQKISQASAIQRAGRAGRTRAGRCLRLYTRHDHDIRPTHDAAEIRRLDLAELGLELAAQGLLGDTSLEWLDPPPPAAMEAAVSLLQRLGAIDAQRRLAPLGRRLLAFPLHPRLGRLVAAGEARGVGSDACVIAAWLAERGDKQAPREKVSGPSDCLDALERFRAEPRAYPHVDRARRQLERTLDRRVGEPADPDEALMQAVLAAYPDRVGKRRRAGGHDIVLAGGGSAELAESSVVKHAELMVVVDVEDRGAAGQSSRPRIRAASAIEAEWLLDLPGDVALREEVLMRWQSQGERVERVERLLYDQLVISETVGPPREQDAEAAARTLAEAAVAAGAARFGGDGELERWQQRAAFVARHLPELELSLPDQSQLSAALAARAQGATRFSELGEAPLVEAFVQALGAARRELDKLAPEHVVLAGGRRVKVHYEEGKPPWIESRLQDFFGMREGPVVARGRVPLTLHLLAPNQRAVQVTSDLAGFWERHYPAIRKELGRRYPRHKWPESPV